jgi:hypothetical protein
MAAWLLLLAGSWLALGIAVAAMLLPQSCRMRKSAASASDDANE